MRLHKNILIFLIVMIVALLVTACGGESSSAGGDNAAAIKRGEKVFETGGASGVACTTCHTTDGTELVGPSLQGINDRAGTRVEGLSAEEYLRQSITDPGAYIVEEYDNTMLPTYGDVLSDENIADLVTYLQSLD